LKKRNKLRKRMTEDYKEVKKRKIEEIDPGDRKNDRKVIGKRKRRK
jgi:hypothetical protein